MSVVINCNRSLNIEKRSSGSVIVTADNVLVELYDYPLGYLNEISFSSYTNSPKSENSGNEKSDCRIRISLVRGGEYIFKYSPELLHRAFADYVLLKAVLNTHMEPN